MGYIVPRGIGYRGMRRKSRPFYTVFFSYVAIFLVPFVISLLITLQVLDVVEKGEREAALSLITKTRDEIDSHLADIRRFAGLIGNDMYIRRFAILEGPIRGTALYDIYELGRHLSAYSRTGRFIESFYIYFRNNHRIVTVGSAIEAEEFYGTYFTYDSMELEEWRNLFLHRSHQGTYLPPRPIYIGDYFAGRMLTYLHSFPSGYTHDPTIAIWVFVNEESIVSRLRSISSARSVYVFDANDVLLASQADSSDTISTGFLSELGDEGFIDTRIDNKKCLIAYTTSPNMGWKYVSIMPYETLLTKTRAIRWTQTGIGVILLLLGVCVSYVLAMWSMKPLRDLVRIVGVSGTGTPRTEYGVGTDAYNFLTTSIRDLIDTNRSLRTMFREQQPMLRAAFFERLFEGRYESEVQIQETLQPLGIDIDGAFHCVVLVRIGTDEGSPMYGRTDTLFATKAVVKGLIHSDQKNGVYVHDRAENELVLLLSFPSSDRERYRERVEGMLERTYGELSIRRRIPVVFSAGTPRDRLSDVWYSYRESLEASESMRKDDSFIVRWYGTDDELPSGYYYPVDLEEKLTNNVKAGHTNDVEKILSLIHLENNVKRSLSAAMMQYLIHDLICTIVKTLDQIASEDSSEHEEIMDTIRSIRRHKAFRDAYESITDTFRRMCIIADGRKRSHRSELARSIMEFITEHCGEMMLNRDEVAGRFMMTPEYLSAFFKEQTGTYFSVFLEQVRMEKAYELLADDVLPVYRIAESVGYGSVNAFCRAFKRTSGLSPGDYRKMQVR